MKAFKEPGTIGELIVQLESFEYSHEYFEIMKESFEVQLMERMVETSQYMKECAGLDTSITSCLITESADLGDEYLTMLESKQGNLFTRAWAFLKRIWKNICNAFTRIFGSADSKKKLTLDMLDLNDELGNDLKSVFDELQGGLITKSDGKNRREFTISSKDAKNVNTRLLAKKALTFVNDGEIEISLPEKCDPKFLTKISPSFNHIANILNDPKGDAGSAIKKACDAAISQISAAKGEIKIVKKYYRVADGAAAAKELNQLSTVIYKVEPREAANAEKDTNVGEAVAALNELNKYWADTVAESIRVNTKIVEAQAKFRKVLEEATKGNETDNTFNDKYKNKKEA